MKNLFLILAFVLSLPAMATTRYVAATAGTFSGGTACNGHTAITLATWNSTTLTAGDITYVCGTITGAAGASGFDFSQSGTSGNPMQLIFDTGADLTAPYWSTGGAISISGRSYIVIDGGGAGGTNGIIEDTANGSAKTYQQDSVAILGPCTPGCEIKNLLVQNLYVHSSSSDSHAFSVDGFYYTNGSTQGISIHDNVAHDMHWVLTLLNWGTADSGLNVYNNYFYNMDHGMAVGTETTGLVWTALQIHDNHFGSTNVWDTTGDDYHHDGIHLFPYCNGSTSCSTTYLSGYIYNNLFDGNWGVNNSAFAFCEATENNLYLFNNVFINTQSGVNMNDGATDCGGPGSFFLNNTLIANASQSTFYYAAGCNGVGACSSNLMTAKNNAFTGGSTLIYVPTDMALVTGGLDYNVYDCNSGSSNCWIYHSTSYTNSQFSTWKTSLNTDSSSEQHSANTTGILLSSVGVPQTGSPVIGSGTNLTSLCSGVLVALCSTTSAGNTVTPIARPASGAWDTGAYQYASSGIVTVGISGGSGISGGAGSH